MKFAYLDVREKKKKCILGQIMPEKHVCCRVNSGYQIGPLANKLFILTQIQTWCTKKNQAKVEKFPNFRQ
jgi:hypothetical protein